MRSGRCGASLDGATPGVLDCGKRGGGPILVVWPTGSVPIHHGRILWFKKTSADSRAARKLIGEMLQVRTIPDE